MQVPNFSKEDFLSGTKPYEFVHRVQDDPFEHQRAIQLVSEKAKQHGVSNFRKMYRCYSKSLEKASRTPDMPEKPVEEKALLNKGISIVITIC